MSGAYALGAFKTPALRGVPATAPYGHGGTLATLGDVLKVYSTAGLAAGDTTTTGTIEPWIPPFSQDHADELLPRLARLTAPAN